MGWLRQFTVSSLSIWSEIARVAPRNCYLLYIISPFDCFPSLYNIYKHFVAPLARLMSSQLLTPLHLLQMRLIDLQMFRLRLFEILEWDII